MRMLTVLAEQTLSAVWPSWFQKKTIVTRQKF